jgi:transcriptional antiterminator NusG
MLPQDAPPVSFKVGEQVRISGGPFASFSGVVEEIDDARTSMKIALHLGRLMCG